MQSIATGGGPGDLTSALIPLADLIPHGPRSTTKQQWAFKQQEPPPPNPTHLGVTQDYPLDPF